MAQEELNTQTRMQETVGETKDREMFDFMGKKEEGNQHISQEENISSELGQKAQVSSEDNKPGLMEKLHRSNSFSSSEEEVEEGGQKIRRKKGLTEKIKDKITGHEDEAEKKECVGTGQKEEEKEGIIEQIKEKVTGHEKNEEHMSYASPPSTPASVAVEGHEGQDKEDKGLLEKIKEKIPGMHSKTEDDRKD